MAAARGGAEAAAAPLAAHGEYPPPGSPLRGVRAAWFAAVKAGDVAAAGALLAGGAHLDESGAELRCERGATALMWAASGPAEGGPAEGHDALLRLLLAHGCDVEARCSRAGGSALVWAASRNQLTSLRTLLAAGADAGRPAPPRDAQGGWDVQSDGTPMGETALMVAAQYGYADAVAILAAAGQLEVTNEYQQRALHVAAMFGRSAAARVLLCAGASLECRDGDGATPLALAAEHGHGECALELLWRGADAAAADGEGATPRDAAAAAGRADVVALLEAWGRGELLRWNRTAHAFFPAPFRADVRATLLAMLGSRRYQEEEEGQTQHLAAAPASAHSPQQGWRRPLGCVLAPGANPLRALREHSLLDALLEALLTLHMEGPPCRAPPPQLPPDGGT